IEFAPNARLIHVKAGPARYVAKQHLADYLPEFVCGVKRFCGAVRQPYDLVHGHYYLSGWSASILAHCWQIPHVQSFHTLARVKNQALPESAVRESSLRIRMEANVMATADLIIATSPSDKQEMIRFYGVAPQKVAIVPPGLDLGLFRPMDRAEAKRSLGLADRRVLLFVGRMDRIKGVETLLRATAQLLRSDPQFELLLLIVGGDRQIRVMDDASRELLRLRAIVSDLGLRQAVRFVGPKEQSELPTYYAAADVCAVPSYAESFGMVAVEAMACGTPVVAAGVGGLQSTIVDGETGFLVPRHDPALFADRIAQLMRSPELRRRFGQAGTQRARGYRWPVVARQLYGAYLSLLTAAP
ncbi:MAG: glycosyltransferase, partial [Chloroflexota bacterium]|nr:glycosyltransferase [Chloroflexota bacterium]